MYLYDNFIGGNRRGRLRHNSNCNRQFTTKLKVTLSYGNRTVAGESGNFAINYAATPTPTATPTLTPTLPPTPTPSPTPSPTTTEPVDDTAPIITARASTGRVAGKARLRYVISDASSENLDITVKISRAGRTIGEFSTTAAVNESYLNWNVRRHRAGKYRFCLSTAEQEQNDLEASCAQLLITSS